MVGRAGSFEIADAVPDADVLGRYGHGAPRYTSYPSALHFRESDPRHPFFDPPDARQRDELSLYVHLPFCRRRCYFCGCNVAIGRGAAWVDAYLDALEREMERRSGQIGPDHRVTQLHFGGGTPTFLSARQLERLIAGIERTFRVAADAERAIEIDPRNLSDDQIAILGAAGFRRASLGLQDTNPAVQRAIGREQSAELVERAVEALRSAGFDSLNFDLMYGLPGQTADTMRATVREAVAWRPDRLAVFGYAHVPHVHRHQRAIPARGRLPAAEERVALFRTAARELQAAGYRFLGLDHFALPGDALARAADAGNLTRNFQGYSIGDGRYVLGLGVSAISQSGRAYGQNAKDLAEYVTEAKAGRSAERRGIRLSADDRVRGRAIQHIMCRGRLDFDAFAEETGVDPRKSCAEELSGFDDLAGDRLVDRDDNGITVTPMGRYFLRSIAMRFDAYRLEAGTSYSSAV